MGGILFTVTVSKDHVYSQPTIRLNDINGIQAALYHQRAGGGNSFVLAIDDTPQGVSLQAVKAQQRYGHMLAYTRVW
jgi:hypothetical protein